jgi:Concanavalin A-like lectin/glucanases superfamily/PEP-CTERM motif
MEPGGHLQNTWIVRLPIQRSAKILGGEAELIERSLALARYPEFEAKVNSPTVSMPTDAWNQVIVERSGNTLSIYLDGTLVVSDTSFVGSITSSPNPLLFGTRDAQDGRDFAVDGRLDEIAIWNRALSSSEIASLWNNGAGQLIPAASVPEPSSLMLAAIAFVLVGGRGGFMFFRRR